MKEIGGYIELDHYGGKMLHDEAVHLNCGRNALAYLIEVKGIRTIALPYFLCTSVGEVCRSNNLKIRYYHITESFLPEELILEKDEWLYVVNYYGQLDHEQIGKLKKRYSRIIVDNAQAYYDQPYPEIDTLYTARKYFGVPDGAFLYTDRKLERELPIDVSHDRMGFLLGRYEGNASDFYREYAENNKRFAGMEIRKMSLLTENLLKGIDYDRTKQIRTDNFACLHRHFQSINQLKLISTEGSFAYPLYIEGGAELRAELIAEKIYIPILWPNVRGDAGEGCIDTVFADNILPIPCDQRYGEEEMNYICSRIDDLLKKE